MTLILTCSKTFVSFSNNSSCHQQKCHFLSMSLRYFQPKLLHGLHFPQADHQLSSIILNIFRQSYVLRLSWCTALPQYSQRCLVLHQADSVADTKSCPQFSHQQCSGAKLCEGPWKAAQKIQKHFDTLRWHFCEHKVRSSILK